ncbi:MAG TPA: SMC-Scp complex subunit ScpB [Pseudomonadales bacterium]|nr:SMC-Scp complex subunit ScpB [Pseudomonadales bacterium]
MSIEQLARILEGAMLSFNKPLSEVQMEGLFDDEAKPSKQEIRAALALLQEQCVGRGVELNEVASGWRYQVCQDVSPWVSRLWDERPQRYSRALLETLALVAYRQPITRGEIEDIRGVAVSSHIMKTLLEREWVKVIGHRDVPGRPAMYATTRHFLDYFNMQSLNQLPSLAEIRDLDKINRELDLDDTDPDTVPTVARVDDQSQITNTTPLAEDVPASIADDSDEDDNQNPSMREDS